MQSPKIKVVDSIMGSGKTSAAINLLSQDTDHNYIFITPYLSEVERIKSQCNSKRFHEPKYKTVDGEFQNKFDSLHKLLAEKKNIVSTHALFQRSNEETRELIKSGNYVLILDEVMNVIEQLELKTGDVENLFNNFIYIDDEGFVCWREDQLHHDSRYNDIKEMAINKSLIYYRDTFFIWTFPVDVFKSFQQVYILTYLFESQIQKCYYDLYKVEYEKYVAIKENDLYTFKKMDNSHTDKDLKAFLKSKIAIYEGNLNDIGELETALSKSWYRSRKESIKVLKNNTENYFKNKVKAKSEETMWTTFKHFKDKVKGRGYSKGFVSCNARATNEFKEKKHLAYTIQSICI
ncbi:hypothetical protein BRE01_62440 [Brevibacillus reuszeri]|uniref:Replication origin-binding protein domain-containing protein n=1 Tax=Brevibacillus reuszeri TaxID=54915 RepID=A0ABQ0TXI1_9BACL|nr:hypothetical protein [Brevibacillus reuszeri]GED72542.1 hypothetical protein BRE01_62440 [Brevibacillus reuszeri]